MHTQRLSRLLDQLRSDAIDVLALMPGPNLFYLTGLSFHLSERPIVALFPSEEPPIIILPALEASKVHRSDVTLEVLSYTDEKGPEAAFRKACKRLTLDQRTIGAEELRMRLFELRWLERFAPQARIVPAERVLAWLRMRKDEHEVTQMRRAIAVTEKALDATLEQVEPGMTERELASLVRLELLRAGGEALAFAPIAVTGPNAASPHATPGERAIRPGETVIVDCGASVGSYAADITRTFVVGAWEPELARVHEVVRAANRAGRQAARPGVPAEAVDAAARAVIEQAGYGEQFIHRTGHGLGLEVHEPPYIVAGNQRTLKPGMIFTVEPGIYLPGHGGVRIEDDVLVTDDGGESLTTFPRDAIALST